MPVRSNLTEARKTLRALRKDGRLSPSTAAAEHLLLSLAEQLDTSPSAALAKVYAEHLARMTAGQSDDAAAVAVASIRRLSPSARDSASS